MPSEEQQHHQQQIAIIPREILEQENSNLAKKFFSVKAWEAYFAAPGKEFDQRDMDHNGVIDPYWAVHLNTLEAKAVRRRNGEYVVVPLGFEKIVFRYPYSYADDQTNEWVMQRTGGDRYRQVKIPTYDYMTDSFIASKLRPYIEQEGYDAQIVGDLLVKNLYDVGVKKGIFPQSSILFDRFEIDQLQSYFIGDYRGDPNATLTYRAFRPKETIPVDEQLMLSERDREKMRLLKELDSTLRKMKVEETKTAALLQVEKENLMLEKQKAEEEYQTMEREYRAQYQAQLDKMTKQLYLDAAQGPEFENAETVVEEDYVHKFDWPIFGSRNSTESGTGRHDNSSSSRRPVSLLTACQHLSLGLGQYL
jgi:hypothetical protein